MVCRTTLVHAISLPCRITAFSRGAHNFHLISTVLQKSKNKTEKLQHASEAAMKPNRVLACMRRGFINLCFYNYTSQWFNLQLLEYGNVSWGPHYVLDQCKLEGVQRHATKLVPSLIDESYIDQLTSLIYHPCCTDSDVVT